MIRFLHTNDFHGALTEQGASFLSQHRSEDLYFDSGDAVRSGNLAIPLRTEAVWARLQQAGCTASVIGNRESHPLIAGLRAKLNGAAHPVLCANLVLKGSDEPPLAAYRTVAHQGVRVTVMGVSVAMVTARMATQAASNYLWTDPIACAMEWAERLRPSCDVLIALTHIGYRQDVLLAEKCPLIDVILGGHSHTVLAEPERHGSVWVAQGGAHGRWFGEYLFDVEARELQGGLKAFDQNNAPKG